MSLFDSASLIVTPSGYKEDKLYSIKPTDGSGDLVVTRATTATRVNSDGLIEQVPYNLIVRSEQFNVSWITNTAVTADNINSPTGTLTADKIQATTTSAYIYITTTAPNSTIYTVSVYAKAGTSTILELDTCNNTRGSYFNLSNGTIAQTINGTASIESVGNGWYRCSVTETANDTTQEAVLFVCDAAGSVAVTSGKNLYLWGAQINQGSLKEYFPTTDRLDVPRLDYTNSSCPSILVEPQRTNLVQYSEQFDNAYWFKEKGGVALIPVVTPNVETAPDGTTTADRIVFSLNGGTSSSDISQLASGLFSSVSLTRTQSVYIKTTDGSTKVFSFVSPIGVATSITVTPYYQRFTYTTTGINAGTIRLRLRGAGEGTSTNASIAIWGAQYEDGSNATSYIPTIASSVTRNADVISKTGISSLIGQTEGTIYAEINNTLRTYQEGYLIRLFADANNEVWIRKEGGTNTYSARFRANSVNVYTKLDINVLNGNNKIAFAYKSGDLAIYLNGTQIGTSSSTGAFSATVGDLNLGYTSTAFFNDRIKSAIVWKERLSNETLAQLTTI